MGALTDDAGPKIPKTPLALPAIQGEPSIKVMVWGEPGSGKSRFALSFPTPIVADLERSTRLYAAEFGHLVAEPSATLKPHQLVYALAVQIQMGMYPGRNTLVIDPMTDYIDQLEAALIRQLAAKGVNLENLTGLKRAQAYAEINDKIRAELNRLLTLPINVVMVVRAKHLWGMKEGKMQPVGRQADIKEIVPYLADVVLKIERDGTAIVEKSRLAALEGRIKAASYADFAAALTQANLNPVRIDTPIAAAAANWPDNDHEFGPFDGGTREAYETGSASPDYPVHDEDEVPV